MSKERAQYTGDIWASMSKPRRDKIRKQRARTRQLKTIRQLLAAALLATAVSSAVAAGWTHFSSAEGAALQGTYSPNTAVAACSTQSFETPVQLADLHDTGTLVLVNREHAVSAIPARNDMSDAHPAVPVATPGIRLHPLALAATAELFEAARLAGVGPFHVTSGFRDYAHQQELYEQITDKSLVQAPGHSEHHTGLAVDIVPFMQAQAGLPLHQWLDGTSSCERWLAQNSWRYGLILRYPAEAQAITGIAFEPWHFRYVGQVHAWYIWKNDLTFEEYLEQLRSTGGFDVTIDKRNYFVRYVSAENGVVYVPDDKEFSLSGDNRGGYIITAWTQEY
ncbi:MAG: M15 family metallopeptidase [Coriobacteriia bacterium]|nr:M15 family metallopeptidase [Coriobacteriia bacterium]